MANLDESAADGDGPRLRPRFLTGLVLGAILGGCLSIGHVLDDSVGPAPGETMVPASLIIGAVGVTGIVATLRRKGRIEGIMIIGTAGAAATTVELVNGLIS